ncbi:MAG: LacI family transcriptional regulator [Verrucomicrobia bacterium]|nr:MAG: LacI family transcriptional regulator [Verrucomicrobiota bacterium]
MLFGLWFRFPILVSALALLLSGCGRAPYATPPSVEPAPALPKITFAVLPKSAPPLYLKAIEAGARRAAAEFGVEIEWRDPLVGASAFDQAGGIEQRAGAGLQGILLDLSDAETLAAAVRLAAERGLPIAIFGTPPEGRRGTNFINYTATDERAAGITAALTLEALLGGESPHGGQVLGIGFTADFASTRQREEGFTFELAKIPALKLAAQQATDGTVAGAQRVAEALLRGFVKNNTLELAGVFASHAAAAEGTYLAIIALRERGVVVATKFVGFDDSPLLVRGLHEGVIDALLVEEPERMGYLGIKSLVEHTRGRAVEPYINSGVRVKTKANTPAP